MTIGGLHKKVDLFFIFDIDNTINVCGLLSISFIDNRPIVYRYRRRYLLWTTINI